MKYYDTIILSISIYHTKHWLASSEVISLPYSQTSGQREKSASQELVSRLSFNILTQLKYIFLLLRCIDKKLFTSFLVKVGNISTFVIINNH